jgi:hypothetical protein
MTTRGSNPYAILGAIAAVSVLLIVVGFAAGGYTREAIVVLFAALLAVAVIMSARRGRLRS